MLRFVSLHRRRHWSWSRSGSAAFGRWSRRGGATCGGRWGSPSPCPRHRTRPWGDNAASAAGQHRNTVSTSASDACCHVTRDLRPLSLMAAVKTVTAGHSVLWPDQVLTAHHSQSPLRSCSLSGPGTNTHWVQHRESAHDFSLVLTDETLQLKLIFSVLFQQRLFKPTWIICLYVYVSDVSSWLWRLPSDSVKLDTPSVDPRCRVMSCGPGRHRNVLFTSNKKHRAGQSCGVRTLLATCCIWHVCVCVCVFVHQGDERGRWQSGRRQQSARHRVHRLPHVAEHRRQRQGNTHTHTHTHTHRGVSHTHDLITGCSWLCVCVCVCVREFPLLVSVFYRLTSLCSPDEVRLIPLTLPAVG